MPSLGAPQLGQAPNQRRKKEVKHTEATVQINANRLLLLLLPLLQVPQLASLLRKVLDCVGQLRCQTAEVICQIHAVEKRG